MFQFMKLAKEYNGNQLSLSEPDDALSPSKGILEYDSGFVTMDAKWVNKLMLCLYISGIAM